MKLTRILLFCILGLSGSDNSEVMEHPKIQDYYKLGRNRKMVTEKANSLPKVRILPIGTQNLLPVRLLNFENPQKRQKNHVSGILMQDNHPKLKAQTHPLTDGAKVIKQTNISPHEVQKTASPEFLEELDEEKNSDGKKDIHIVTPTNHLDGHVLSHEVNVSEKSTEAKESQVLDTPTTKAKENTTNSTNVAVNENNRDLKDSTVHESKDDAADNNLHENVKTDELKEEHNKNDTISLKLNYKSDNKNKEVVGDSEEKSVTENTLSFDTKDAEKQHKQDQIEDKKNQGTKEQNKTENNTAKNLNVPQNLNIKVSHSHKPVGTNDNNYITPDYTYAKPPFQYPLQYGFSTNSPNYFYPSHNNFKLSVNRDNNYVAKRTKSNSVDQIKSSWVCWNNLEIRLKNDPEVSESDFGNSNPFSSYLNLSTQKIQQNPINYMYKNYDPISNYGSSYFNYQKLPCYNFVETNPYRYSNNHPYSYLDHYNSLDNSNIQNNPYITYYPYNYQNSY